MGRESNNLTCANCGYDQRGNPDSAVCPECGFVSEGECFEFGHSPSPWFIPFMGAGCLALILLLRLGAHPWLSLAAAIALVGLIVWDALAKRRRPKAQILVNPTGFRAISTEYPRGRWVTWDKVVAVNESGLANIIFIAFKDPHASQVGVGPIKDAKQKVKVRAAIARYYPGELEQVGQVI